MVWIPIYCLYLWAQHKIDYYNIYYVSWYSLMVVSYQKVMRCLYYVYVQVYWCWLYSNSVATANGCIHERLFLTERHIHVTRKEQTRGIIFIIGRGLLCARPYRSRYFTRSFHYISFTQTDIRSFFIISRYPKVSSKTFPFYRSSHMYST